MQHAVIMAGGSGTRFWPNSRAARPKQLMRLLGERTMIQSTVDRIADWIPPERTWVVTNAAQADETLRQLPQLDPSHVLIEPCGRNTAPCVGLAAIQLEHVDPEASMLVMPADHVIEPPEKFNQAVRHAFELVEQDGSRFVLFGVPPSYAATGYGYIERGEPLGSEPQAYDVSSFREKPDEATAQEFVQSGRFYWNCGIFVWKAGRILEAIRTLQPRIGKELDALVPAIGTGRWEAALAEHFPKMTSIAIDHAVLEHADTICVLEAPFAWDDVGSWHALPRLLGSDEAGNTIDGEHCGIATRNCIVRSEGGHVIATFGIEDCIIVHTQDATLVARRDDEGAVKELVAELGRRGHERVL